MSKVSDRGAIRTWHLERQRTTGVGLVGTCYGDQVSKCKCKVDKDRESNVTVKD